MNSENMRLEEENAKAKKSLSAFVKMQKESSNTSENLAQLKTQNKFLQEKLSEMDKPDLEKEQLRDTVRTLQLELQHTKDEATHAQSLKAAYTSDKKAYSEAISQVDQQRDELNSKIMKLEQENSELGDQVRAAKEQGSVYLSQTQNLRKELENTQQSFARANKQSLSSTEETYSLRQQISGLSSQNQVLVGENENLKFELDRAAKMRKAAEEQLDVLRKEEFKSKSQVDSHSAEKQRLLVLHENAVKEIGNLKEEILYLTKLREKDKAAVLDFEEKIRSLNSELAGAEHRIRVVQQEHATISDELSEKLNLLRQQQNAISVAERELAELRPVKVKYHSQQENLKMAQEHSSSFKEDSSKLQRQLAYIEDQLQEKDHKIQDLQVALEQSQDEKLALEGKLDDLENQILMNSGNSRHSEALNSETQLLKQQILEMREKERDLLRALEQSKGCLLYTSDAADE